MSNRIAVIHLSTAFATLAFAMFAFVGNSDTQQRRPGSELSDPVTLAPDDKAAHPAPPAGFKSPREAIPSGKLERIEYESKTVGTTRRMQVYTPPNYSTDTKCPVLYLLHGVGGDETEWQRFASPGVMFFEAHLLSPCLRKICWRM